MKGLHWLLAIVFVLFVAGFAFVAKASPTAAPVSNGGTGTSTLPGYGQVLIGGKSGEYEYVATSTFGSSGGGTGFATTSADYWLTTKSTTNLAEGSNLYWTQTRFDNALTATTSLPKITTLAGLLLPYSQITGTPDLTAYLTLAAWYATTTNQLREGSNNLYFTNARARSAISLTTTGSSGAATYNSSTGVLNVPQYSGTTYTGTFPINVSGSAISFGGIGTSSAPAIGNLAYWTGANSLGTVATSTLTPSSPLTGSFVQIGSSGSLGIQAASGSQNGYLSSTDYSLLHTATTTFSAPLVYTGSTNAVTCPTCITAAAPWPWTIATNYGTTTNATTTPTWYKQGAFASSTSATPGLAVSSDSSGRALEIVSNSTGPTLWMQQNGTNAFLITAIAKTENANAIDIAHNPANATLATTKTFSLANNTNARGILAYFANNGTNKAFQVDNWDTTDYAARIASQGYGLYVSANGAGGSNTPFKVASGTATSTILELNSSGQLAIGGTQVIGHTLEVGATSTQNTARINGISTANNTPCLSLFRSGTVEWSACAGGTAASDFNLSANPNSTYTDASIAATAKLTVKSSSNGNVGISSSTPWAKLSLNLNGSDTNQFAFLIASTTSGTGTTTLFAVSNTGSTTISSLLNVPNASTTVVSAATLCLTGDSCRTTWPASTGSGLGTTSPISAGNLLEYSSVGAGSAFGIATSSLAFSGPFSGAASLGALVGGSNSTVTWTGLSTSSQPSSSNLLVSNGGSGVFGVATTSGTCGSGVSCTAVPYIGSTNPSFSLDQSFGAVWTAASTTYTQHLSLNTASTTQLTAPTLWTGLTAYNVLTTDANGKMVASSSIGNSLLPNSGALTINTSAPLGGGGSVALGGTLTLTCATCGGGGSGNVATSTGETAGQLPYWTTTNGTPAKLGSVATSTISFSGPFSGFSSLGTLVGGSNSTVTWTGLSTTSQPSSSNVLVSNGAAGVYGAATSSETCSAPLSCGAHVVLAGGGAISWTGLSTTSQPSSSNLLVSNGSNGVYGVATSTLSASSPLTGSFTQVGSGGSLGIQAATAGQNGYLSSTDYSLLHTGTTTFSSPLVYTGSTNAVTCPTCITAVASDPFTHPATTQSATTSTMLFFGSASTSKFTATSSVWLTGVTASRPLYVDSNGLVGSAGSGVSGNCVQWAANNTLGDAGSACGTGGGTDIFSHPTATQSATTSTILFYGNASTTKFTATSSVWFTGTTNAVLSTDQNGLVGATTSIGVNYLTGILPVAKGGTNASSIGSHLLVAFDGTSYVSTSTPTAAAYLATSTTATSTFAGAEIFNVPADGRPIYIGTSTTGVPIYGIVPGGIDFEYNFNGTTAFNAVNDNTGSCASSGFFGDGNIAALNSDFTGVFFTNAGWTGVGCAFGNGKERPESTVIPQPTGDEDFELASSSPVAFNWYIASTTNIMKLTSPQGQLMLGTTTPAWGLLTLGTSTKPQITLSDNNGADNNWFMRWINNTFYMGTSSPTATSTPAALTFDASQTGGSLSVGSSSPTFPAKNGLVTIGNNGGGATGSTTISTGNIQIDGYNTAGSRVCVFVVGTTLTVGSGACTQ